MGLGGLGGLYVDDVALAGGALKLISSIQQTGWLHIGKSTLGHFNLFWCRGITSLS